MDYLTPQQRSKNMAAIRNKNTKPEMIAAWAVETRFQIHDLLDDGSPNNHGLNIKETIKQLYHE